jgi:hypothetical protein
MNDPNTPGGDVQAGERKSQDKQQGDLRNPTAEPLETPEGLKRPRRGPLDKELGRGDGR